VIIDRGKYKYPMKTRKFQSATVQKAYNSYPRKITDKLLILRELIFRIAGESD